MWVLGLGAVGYFVYTQRQQVESDVQTGVEDVQAAVQGWQTVGQGPLWVPVINGAENRYGIPPNLLARMAYQESRFRPDVIDGSTPNASSGALGILQMLPKYFSAVAVPLPFTQADTANQIDQAAQELARLFTVYHDWGLAVAAYNDGEGNIDAYLKVPPQHVLPQQTIDYVAEVFADVPVSGATILA